jgi:hypothetical protein
MQFNPFSVAIAGLLAVVLMTVLGPIAKAYARKVGQSESPRQMPGDVEARLARIEQAIESIAVEVERVSEGQRFTTKLLSEQRGNLPADQSRP